MAPPSRVVSVTIRYAKPGTQPPVYLAGSFSDWEPQEMQQTSNTDGEPEFIKEIQVEQGKEYQYKFRMGYGDWWVLCDDSPTATDDSGNKNNLLSVPESKQPELEQSKDSSPATLPHTKETPTSADMDGKTGVTENPTDQKPMIQNQEQSPEMTLPAKSSIEEKSNTSSPAPEIQATDREPSHLKLPDASNDNTKTHPRSTTPDVAQVAAEVADSAAKLDNGPPSPEIADDEAGRIGYRRMSSTPIPEVSETAAEVADVAAKIDRPRPSKIEMPSPPLSLEEEEIYAPTPEHERVPLFPHECPGPTDKVVKSRNGGSRDASPLIPSQQINEEIDTNDPSLESFPTTREGVYEKIRSLENRLPPDESPVTSPSTSRQPERLDLPSPSPRLLAQERSPSLGAIEEEHELDEADRNSMLTETITQEDSEASQLYQPASPTGRGSKKGSTKSERLETEVSKYEEGSSPSGDNQPPTNSTLETPKDEPVSEVATEESHVQPKTIVGDPEVVADKKSPTPTPITELQKNDNAKANDVPETPEEEGIDTIRENTEVEPIPFFTDAPGSLVKSSDEASRGRAPTITIHRAATPKEIPTKDAPTSASLNAVPPPVATPFIVDGERQLGHGKEQDRELLAGDQGPSITLQAATPRASLRTIYTDLTEATDVGESTSVATSGRSSELTPRKKQRAMTPPDRPLTPSSMRSNNDVKSRNFLKAFWRVVFVDWIGGLLARCFGGGRDS